MRSGLHKVGMHRMAGLGIGRVRACGFSLIELLVAISIIALLIGILMPSLSQARKAARQTKSASQVRGIQSAMILYANFSNRYYPGLNEDGLLEATTAGRFQPLLEGSFFAPEYIISPLELRTRWTSGAVTIDHFSYAMLQIDDPEPDNRLRRSEWRDTGNPECPVVSDRNLTWDDPLVSPTSVHTGTGENVWLGNVAWNDNHVTWETDIDLERTRFASGAPSFDDSLFDADDGAEPSGNTAMVYGNTSIP